MSNTSSDRGMLHAKEERKNMHMEKREGRVNEDYSD